MSASVRGEMDVMTGSGQTTGAATSTLASVPGPAVGQRMLLDVLAWGGDASNNLRLGRHCQVKNASGTLSIAYDSGLIATILDLALVGATVFFQVNGLFVDIKVTGVTAKTIEWRHEVTPRY